jgi:hypothetical protein
MPYPPRIFKPLPRGSPFWYQSMSAINNLMINEISIFSFYFQNGQKWLIKKVTVGAV